MGGLRVSVELWARADFMQYGRMSHAENPVLQAMRAHRSIRAYSKESLDDETVRACVAAAQHASTSSNVQAYCVLRVRDEERRRTLAHLCGDQDMVARAGAFFVICGDARRHRLVAEDKGCAYESNLECFLLAAIDAALFAQNLALAFESCGLGMCFIGGLRNRLPEVDELLELPHGVFPFFGMCVGAPAQEPMLRPRLSVDAVLFDERYPSDDEMRAHIAGYDSAIEPWYAARGKVGHDWSGAIARRFSKRLREHLHAFFEEKGARLR